MARFMSFCALFMLIGSIVVVAAALSQPVPVAARETATAPHATSPSPVVSGHGTFAQPAMAQLQSTEAGTMTIDSVDAFPVMLIAAMLMTCAAASIIARDRFIE